MTLEQARELHDGDLVWFVPDNLGTIITGTVFGMRPGAFNVRWEGDYIERGIGTYSLESDEWQLSRLFLDRWNSPALGGEK